MDLVYDRTDKNGTKIYLDYNCRSVVVPVLFRISIT